MAEENVDGVVSTVPDSDYSKKLQNLVKARQSAVAEKDQKKIKKVDEKIDRLKKEINAHGYEHEVFAVASRPSSDH